MSPTPDGRQPIAETRNKMLEALYPGTVNQVLHGSTMSNCPRVEGFEQAEGGGHADLVAVAAAAAAAATAADIAGSASAAAAADAWRRIQACEFCDTRNDGAEEFESVLRKLSGDRVLAGRNLHPWFAVPALIRFQVKASAQRYTRHATRHKIAEEEGKGYCLLLFVVFISGTRTARCRAASNNSNFNQKNNTKKKCRTKPKLTSIAAGVPRSSFPSFPQTTSAHPPHRCRASMHLCRWQLQSPPSSRKSRTSQSRGLS